MLRAPVSIRFTATVLASLWMPAPPAQDSDSQAGIDRYNRALAEQRWDRALNEAEQLLRRLKADSSAQPALLIDALSRLGTVQSALKDHSSSEASFAEAVQLAESAFGPFDERVIAPLRGFIAALLAKGEFERAVPVIEHAIKISSRAHGIFDARNAGLLQLLADAQTALGHYESAERSLKQLVQVHEHSYSAKDIRTLNARVLFAEWYAYVGEIRRAQALLHETIRVAEKQFGASAPELIAPLTALGRSHIAHLIYGPRIVGKLKDPNESSSVWIGHRVRGYVPPQWPTKVTALRVEGERAFTRALRIAESDVGRNANSIFALLLELGDWHQFQNEPDEAIRFYTRAQVHLREHASRDTSADAFSFPVNIFLPMTETSDASSSSSASRFVLVEYGVTATGSTTDVHIVETNATEKEKASALRAVVGARYRPRFENEVPVKTGGMRYRFIFK